MKWGKSVVLISLLLATLAGSTAWAHGRARVGVYVGVPGVSFVSPYHYYPRYYYPRYYYSYPPYYYYPAAPLVVTPPAPPVYIEKGQQQAEAAPSSNYWYYCQNPQGYYPYVKECPGGWQQVAPRPPAHP